MSREVFDQLLIRASNLTARAYPPCQAEVAQGAAQVVLDGDGLRLQQLAMGQQHAQLLAA